MKMTEKILMVLILTMGVISIALAAGGVKQQVTVKDVSGIVDVKKAGTDTWAPAAKGMTLMSGDAIRTTIDSAVDLVFENGSIIRLNEETNLTVEDLSENVEKARFLYVFDRNVTAKKTKFKLDEGNIMAAVTEVGNSKSQFTVQTPKGIAGVRGTNWSIGSNELAVTSGFIDWVPKNQLNSDGAGLPFIADVRRAIAGGRGGDMAQYNYTRVNEGSRATLDSQGNIANFSVIPQSQVLQINTFVRTALNWAATQTHSQAAADKIFDKDYMGQGGIGGVVTTGQAAGNLQGQEVSSYKEATGQTTTETQPVSPPPPPVDPHGMP